MAAMAAGLGGSLRAKSAITPGQGPTLVDMSLSPDDAHRVPIESVRCGDPIYDADGGCQHYKVLEARPIPGGGVVMELECLQNNQCQVIEKSFPQGYLVGRSTRHFL